ncbi:MAG: amylo-alpha-1,6-glucosidase [Planctomycetaceae bacterium]
MQNVLRRLNFDDVTSDDHEQLLTREWLVTNGLGGYASGTVAGVATRRYHGLLIAALPAPYGRTLMLAHLAERLRLNDNRVVDLGGEERIDDALNLYGADYLSEFRLENGLPIWSYRIGDVVVEKRIIMPHEQNTVFITYRLVEGNGPVRLKLMPSVHFRSHDDDVGTPPSGDFRLKVVNERFEITAGAEVPPLRMTVYGSRPAFTFERKTIPELVFRIERRRGYPSRGNLWSPGYFRFDLDRDHDVTLVASSELWDTVLALSPDEAFELEHERRRRILEAAPAAAQEGFGSELVLAADQFLIKPAGRADDAAFMHAAGDEVRTVIAGYHWFTDWGRDTMISLEGLTLATGRDSEARSILRTFGHYVCDGLIPNMFPERCSEGLYHTADASLWFFHALDRYLTATGDRATLQVLLPRMRDIVRHHLHGTRFGIGVDPRDGLLKQGQEGYQLTWMDAKVDDWVVTPRRGKAVEINALWYNALCLLMEWIADDEEGEVEYAALQKHAEQARDSFNARFWYEKEHHLYDVVDGENGDDWACRPNQIYALSLKYPVLDEQYWKPVVETVTERLLTPVGLRSLAPGHPQYKPIYSGDLRARDAAYHQGTVWAFLIGPFIDAWMRVHPEDGATARQFLEGFEAHLSEACIGTISEVFDAEAPYTARGCAAQAWSVAEVLRCWVRTHSPKDPADRGNPMNYRATAATGPRG